MARIFNRNKDKEKRKELRHQMTTAELLVWQSIRASQVDGHRFRRQYSVIGFVLDFYCPQKKVAIEIDGESHFTEQGIMYDQERSDIIESFGIHFLRFTNKEVRENISGVLECIRDVLGSTPSISPLHKGE